MTMTSEQTIAFGAYARGTGTMVADTPLAAAERFFANYPSKRKVSIQQGTQDSGFFTVRLSAMLDRAKSWDDLPKKAALDPATYA